MQFTFKVRCDLTLEHTPGDKTSKHVKTDFNLEVSKNIDASKYLTRSDLPTAEGSKVITNVLVQGLVGNIHNSHQRGFRDSAEHLRYVIAELEKGFAHPATSFKSNFDE